MKLRSVHIRMFRNILDSSQVAIDEKVTCLVGKNESGKSAFLHALWRLNPARTNPKSVIHDHYPAWLEKRHRNEGKNLEEVEPVEVCLEWEQDDVKAIEEKFGSGVVRAGTQMRLWKSYGNELQREIGCNEQQAVKNFIQKNYPTRQAGALRRDSELRHTIENPFSRCRGEQGCDRRAQANFECANTT